MLSSLLIVAAAASLGGASAVGTNCSAGDANLFQFSAPNLAGDTVDFAKFKGKVSVVVNVASF